MAATIDELLGYVRCLGTNPNKSGLILNPLVFLVPALRVVRKDSARVFKWRCTCAHNSTCITVLPVVANPTIAPLAIRPKMAGGVLYYLSMKKIAYALAAVIVAAAVYATPSEAANKVISTGTCFNGATWTLTAVRSGDKVTATFVASKMQNQIWNVNWAWNPSNKVYNEQLFTKKGKLTSVNTSTSKQPLTAFVFVDEPWAYTLTCAASVTI